MIKKKITRQLASLLPNFRLTFVSTYPPEHCGIGVFTKNLTDSLNVLNPQHPCRIIALKNTNGDVTYPHEVVRVIRRSVYQDYLKAASIINRSNTQFLLLQHEFSIYGGDNGDYIIPFLKRIKKPKIVVLHSALSTRIKKKRELIKAISIVADVVVVLNLAVEKLVTERIGGLNKIVTIPLGVPDMPFGATEYFQKQLGFKNNEIILLACGLISENKGFEYLIKALPQVLKKFPSIKLLIIGEIHPRIKKMEGEKYSQRLEELVKKLNLQPQVTFIKSYLDEEKFLNYIRAADIFCAPHLDPKQSASATLSYAVGMGKACIATPFFYAKDVLGRGKGYLVPFRNKEAIVQAIIKLLSNPEKKEKMEQRCYRYARTRTWVNIGLRYIELFRSLSS